MLIDFGRIKLVLGLLVCLCVGCACGATSLRMEEDRVWLKMDYRVSLRRILEKFEAHGVKVLLDPAISETRVLGQWENVEIGQLLKELVAPNDYMIEWRSVSGPLGDLYKPSVFAVYGKRGRQAAKPLQANRKVLDVVEPSDGSPAYIRDELLVGFGEGATAKDLQDLLRQIGASVVEVIKPPGMYRIKLDGRFSVADAQKLANGSAGVSAVEPNYAMKHPGLVPSGATGGSQGMNLHLAPGEKAIAVFDSGLDPKYAGFELMRGQYNAVNPDEPMSDSSGHGSLVSLIAAGMITPKGMPSASSGVPVLSVRAFDENGYTSTDTMMRAMNYSINSGASIINMSFGSDVDSSVIRSMIQIAEDRGVLLVAAVGNEPTGKPLFPAAYPGVIGVGGLDPSGENWAQSNFGSFVDAKASAFAEKDGLLYRGTSISAPAYSWKLATKGF